MTKSERVAGTVLFESWDCCNIVVDVLRVSLVCLLDRLCACGRFTMKVMNLGETDRQWLEVIQLQVIHYFLLSLLTQILKNIGIIICSSSPQRV